MSAKHTTGPWNLLDDTRVGNSAEVKTICTAYSHAGWGMNKEEAKANAKLIAAAPDLLKYLKKLVEEIEMHGIYMISVGDAEEVIKKATE